MRKILLSMMVLAMTAVPLFAQQGYDIKQMTPSIQAALDARKARFAELKELKAQGLAGENNRGYVQALVDTDDVIAVVERENEDRRVIYKAIIEQNELDPAALDTVEQVFAGVQRGKAAAGEKIQDTTGRWITR